MKTQQGVTLFIVIIILVVATSLAAAVITETRLGQNAIGLTQERLANEQELLGGVEQIINDAALSNNIMAMTEEQGANMAAGDFNTLPIFNYVVRLIVSARPMHPVSI